MFFKQTARVNERVNTSSQGCQIAAFGSIDLH